MVGPGFRKAGGGRLFSKLGFGGLAVCGWLACGFGPGGGGTAAGDNATGVIEEKAALSTPGADHDDDDNAGRGRPPAGCDVELAPTIGNRVPPPLRGPGPWQLCGAFGTGVTHLIETSRNGNRLVLVTDSGQAWVLDAHTFDLLGTFTQGAAVTFAGLSPDGHVLATVDDPGGVVALWNVDEHRLLHVLARPPGVPSYFGLGEASFSRDGKLLAVASAAGVDVFSVSTGAALPISARTDLGSVMRVGFAANDTRLVLAKFTYFGNGPFAGFGSIALVDATTGDNLVPVGLPTSSLVAFAVSGDSHTVAIGGAEPGGPAIQLIDPITGAQITELPAVQSAPLALNNDASRIAVADPPAQPGAATLTVRHTSDGSVIHTVELPPSVRTRVFAVSGNLAELYASDAPPHVAVKVSFGSGTTQRVACGSGHFTEITALGVTRDGSTLVTTGQTVSGDTTLVWNARTGALLNIPPPPNLIVPSATSPDGTLMAVPDGSGPNFDLVDTATNTVVRTLGPAPTLPTSFDFSPNGRLIASDSQRAPADRRAFPQASLWNVAAGTLVQRLPHITTFPLSDAEPVLFAPGGRHLFVGGYATTALWCH